MIIKIVSSHKILYQGDITSVIAPGYHGYFQVLKNHASFISILKSGSIKLELDEKKNGKKEIKIKGGFLQVKKNMVIVIL
ncbi:F0F1 ATP synthase subunit epsilon [Blattabacterium sp. (Blaberus giganteus)]|uniref:F0F1 ATP synthase subunit epsilon n=1 Tax=Blattabacterium sp. (Blaberus giganteus) TaxID=1186051 RepID=UPI00025F703B|nr:F0F1 ATP synthase subunit epsilon [Blattabacterium sp. (Blaberus giganteus)]AFJ90979.1 ATP synthase F1 subunit epsilon [Blattabacterium sp. (Blaberus giganteus)]